MADPKLDPLKMLTALVAFVDSVNATGGLIINDDGVAAPAADESWTDLADAYLKACSALNTQPMCVDADVLADLNAESEWQDA